MLMRSNSSGWRNPNEVRNSVAMEILNLNYRDMQSSRDRLQKAGLVEFKIQNGSKFLTYSLFDSETQTFAPIAKVLYKVSAKVLYKVPDKVSAKVDENTIVLNKLKPKPKDEVQIQHGLFFEKFFSDDAEYDREQILIQIREPEIKRHWAEIFNAHLSTEKASHQEYDKWVKHFRSWLNKKLADLKKGDAVQHQNTVTKKFLS